MLVSNGVSGEIHLIGHIFMMQMDSFNFRVLIRVLELISVLNESWEFIYFNKFQHFVLMVAGEC